MKIDFIPNLTGVFGHPVAENPTVLMMEAGYKAVGLDNWKYLTLEISPEKLKEAISCLRTFNMKGIHLTIPHKVAVLEYLDEISSVAKTMGAVNTVHNIDGKLVGENTDGKGFMESLRKDANINPKGKKVIILGAGGAARAISVELAFAGVDSITIVNRNSKRGEELVQLLSESTTLSVDYVPWESILSISSNLDILVQATSIGLYPNRDKPNINYNSLQSGILVCDVVPNPPQTMFLKEVTRCGCKTLDGLGMLVYQGALAFTMWTGKTAPIREMRQALIDFFNSND